MKVVIALVVCVAFVAAAAFDRDQIERKMKAASNKCMDDPAVGVNRDEMKAFRESKGKGPKPANLGKMSICVLKELGWMKADNSLDTTEFRQIIEDRKDDAAKVKKIMDNCTADKGSPEETANNMLGCVVLHSRKQEAA